MQVLGGKAAMSFASSPDIKAWADRVSLNPARIPPDLVDDAELVAAVERFRAPRWSVSARRSARGWPGWPSSPGCPSQR
jgi:hypothetical protein